MQSRKLGRGIVFIYHSVGKDFGYVFPEVPLVVDETYLVEVFLVFGERLLVDSLYVQLDCSLDEVLEMAGECLFGLL